MNPVIEYILKTHKITDYLDKQGHKPIKSLSRGRLTYLCPFPDHNELKPSFYVWTQSEFENFCCFGCGRNYSIIHLVSGMESISTRQAIVKLSEGVDFTAQFSIEMTIDALNNEYARKQKRNTGSATLEDTIYSISSVCLSYLRGVDYNDSEVTIIDKFFKEVDQHIYNFDMMKLEEMLHYLPEMLLKRREKFEANKRKTTN